ncbi:LysR family transcriptional regulator [Paraburkholderia sp. BL27I4N3]|nr:LysR family transcriptional regulator [Paraburkholderia sp. BL27I4N3]
MDKFVSMEIFVAVVEAGSLTAAAERFDISSAMVGKHIRSLETRLATRLLTRTTRRQSLTEIGRQYYEQCRRILAEVKEAESLAEAMAAAPRGVLKVTVPLTYGVEVFAPAMTEYLTAWPDITLELDLSNRLIDLVEEGFDASVRIGRLPDSSLVARPLKPYRMRACASPAYLARAGTPRTPEDLLHHECLGFLHWGREGLWRLGGDHAEECIGAQGRRAARLRPRVAAGGAAGERNCQRRTGVGAGRLFARWRTGASAVSTRSPRHAQAHQLYRFRGRTVRRMSLAAHVS